MERLLGRASRTAAAALYDRHTPRLMRFVARVSGSADPLLVEDLVQETWLRAVDGLRRFRWRSSFSTWLHAIALNVTRETLRAERWSDRVSVEPHQLAQLAGRTRTSDPDGRIDLERALRLLPEGQRAVLVLHDLEGYTHGEVARLLDITPGTSKSQLHDARRNLEDLLTRGSHPWASTTT